jgi:MFS family permease
VRAFESFTILRLALSLISAAALAYEILLTRLFSIIQWHHFAYMMISVALLGYGAAGTFVSIFRSRIERRFEAVFAASAALFGILAVTCFLVAQQVPFNPLEFLWDPQQPAWLLLIYLLLFVPFFFAALCVCLMFTRFASRAHRVYSFDIIGAAAGCLGVVAGLYVLPPIGVLGATGALALLAGALVWWGTGLKPRLAAGVFGLAAGAIILAAAGPLGQLRMSQYKELSQILKVMGAHVVAEESSPLGLISVVKSPEVPFREAPGLSLNAPDEPPPQLGVFTDGEGMSALTRFDGHRESLAYLDYVTSALPYHLVHSPSVLILGAGAGADVLQALYADASSVDAVELNPQVAGLVQARFAEFSGRPYSVPGVTLHVAEARGFAAAADRRYDVIQLALLDAFGASSAGLYALSESYIYTVEALQAYLHRLSPDGYLSITRWVNLPPRDTLKLFATAVTALEASGVRDPGARLALIRSWKTATLVIKNGALTAGEIAAIKEFCRTRSFDLAWYPGMQPAEADRYNRLDQPYFYEGAAALLGSAREEFIERYKFNIAPATDDRPYFFHFFRWKALPELVRLKQQGGLPLLEWGYPLVVATLAQALLASILLILLPLGLLRRRLPPSPLPRPWLRVASYFGVLGLAFMFVEMAFIQRFILFLSHPLYAVSVVLFAFLLFAGLGSRFSEGLQPGAAGRLSPAAWPVAAIAVLSLLYLVLLPPVFDALIGLPDLAKIPISILLIAPLGFAMGMPFPLGVAAVAAGNQELVPWAWGVNACASVVSAVLATLLAIHAGFTVVLLLALALYLVAAAVFPGPAGVTVR